MAYVGISSKMKDEVYLLHSLLQPIQVHHVPIDEREAIRLKRLSKKLAPTGGEVVVTGDRMSILQQVIDQVAANEAGTAGDYEMQINSPPCLSGFLALLRKSMQSDIWRGRGARLLDRAVAIPSCLP